MQKRHGLASRPWIGQDVAVSRFSWEARHESRARRPWLQSPGAAYSRTCRAVVPSSKLLPDMNVSTRSEEHTSELQSHLNLVCRLLLEKKKKQSTHNDEHIPIGITA